MWFEEKALTLHSENLLITMKTLKILLVIIAFLTVAIAIATFMFFDYHKVRHVPFERAMAFEQPYDSFDGSYLKTFLYVGFQEDMVNCLCKNDVNLSYSDTFATRVCSECDFEKYDYLITLNRELDSLKYSGCLTDHEDCAPWDERTPLISVFKKNTDDSIYVYRIQKTKMFRCPIP